LETRPALISAGDDASPRGTWQIAPFGHSTPEAWRLGSEAGFASLYWGRTDYQDVALRTSNAGKDNNQWLEWVWRGSESLGPAADIFAGELTTGQYAAPIDFNDG
jgi:alpha-mannosidase